MMHDTPLNLMTPLKPGLSEAKARMSAAHESSGPSLRSAPASAGFDDKLREAAEQLVSAAFVVPLLSELRDQPFDADLFGGGFEQDAFRGQLDTTLADRMVHSANWPIVDRIMQQIGGASYRNAQQPGGAA